MDLFIIFCICSWFPQPDDGTPPPGYNKDQAPVSLYTVVRIGGVGVIGGITPPPS